MNLPAEQKTPRYVTCRCQHCDGHIEFDANEFTEDNSIVPCPHCGLETKILIPASQTEKVSTELPPSVANPNAVRREGFFCGGGEPIPAQVSAEQPATEVWREWHPLGNAPELTEDQIKSVGERQNDGMAVKLYHEGDQDMAMSLDDARRYIADPRFKLINPETGLRFTPATLEAFIKAKRLQNKNEAIKQKRQEIWVGSKKATEAQLDYIRVLGGTPPFGLNSSEAHLLIEELLAKSPPPSMQPATEKQIHFIRELGENPPTGLTKSAASSLIEELLAKQHESQARQQSPSPRQIMVLRFWNRMDLEQSSKWEVEQWQNRFYSEDPRRKTAWETFKLENGDDGSQHDPSCVPLGAGERYLNKKD